MNKNRQKLRRPRPVHTLKSNYPLHQRASGVLYKTQERLRAQYQTFQPTITDLFKKSLKGVKISPVSIAYFGIVAAICLLALQLNKLGTNIQTPPSNYVIKNEKTLVTQNVLSQTVIEKQIITKPKLKLIPKAHDTAALETQLEIAKFFKQPIELATQEKPPVARKYGLMLSKLTVIAIDPGHGGIDPGAIGASGLTEKVVTLDIAKRVRTLLSGIDNLHIALTRYDDRKVFLNDRINLIKNTRADLLVSIHINALPQKKLNIVEAYYHKSSINAAQAYNVSSSTTNKTHPSMLLAKAIQDRVFSTVHKVSPNSTNAGVKQGKLHMLTQSNIAGALIEVTCISNKQEELRLNTDEYLQNIAEAIASGITDYLKLNTSAKEESA